MDNLEQAQADRELLKRLRTIWDDLSEQQQQTIDEVEQQIANEGGLGAMIQSQGIRGTRSQTSARIRRVTLGDVRRQKLEKILANHEKRNT